MVACMGAVWRAPRERGKAGRLPLPACRRPVLRSEMLCMCGLATDGCEASDKREGAALRLDVSRALHLLACRHPSSCRAAGTGLAHPASPFAWPAPACQPQRLASKRLHQTPAPKAAISPPLCLTSRHLANGGLHKGGPHHHVAPLVDQHAVAGALVQLDKLAAARHRVLRECTGVGCVGDFQDEGGAPGGVQGVGCFGNVCGVCEGGQGCTGCRLHMHKRSRLQACPIFSLQQVA